MSEARLPPRPSRREWVTITAISALALGLRVWNTVELSAQDPFFARPSIDAAMYHAWAQRIAGGEWLGEGVFLNGPLYPYSLGVLYALFGSSLWVAKLAQSALGAGVCWLTWRLGRRLFSPGVGLLAAGAVAWSQMLIFYGGTLVVANLLTPLLLLVVLSCLAAVDRPTPWRFAAAGLWVGLGALARPNLLGLGILCGLWAGWALAPHTRGQRARWLSAYAAGALLAIAPATLHNYAVSGDFVPITFAGGMNLYLGNNPDSDGSFRVPRSYPQSAADDPFEQREVFARHAEQIVGRPLGPAEVSSFWSSQAWRYVRTQPLDWLSLQRRKLWMMTNQGELWNIRSLELTRDFSAVLRLPLLDFRWLAPLALAGLVATARRWRQLLPLYAVLATVFGTMFIFFVLSRYRAPAVPVLSLFAAAGVLASARSLRRGRQRRVGLWLAALGFGLKVVSLPGLSPDLSIAYYNLGNRYLAAQDWSRAIDAYERTLAVRVNYLSAWNNLALAYEGAGAEVEETRRLWEHVRAMGEARGQAKYVERAERHLKALANKPGGDGSGHPATR